MTTTLNLGDVALLARKAKAQHRDPVAYVAEFLLCSLDEAREYIARAEKAGLVR